MLPFNNGGEIQEKSIDDKISRRLTEVFEYIAEPYGIDCKDWNHDRDHVQVMFAAQPKTPLSKFINAYKSAGRRLIKKERTVIMKSLCKGCFWTQSFRLLTMGGATIGIVRKYIDSQVA